MVSDFNKKQKRKFSTNRLLLISGAILFSVIALLLLFANFKMYFKKQELIKEVDSYKKRIEEIQKKSKTLEEGIVKAGDKDYIEKIAREELDMQKEGEKVVSFVMPERSSAQEKRTESFWSMRWLQKLSCCNLSFFNKALSAIEKWLSP